MLKCFSADCDFIRSRFFQIEIDKELDASIEEIKELRTSYIDITSIKENLFILGDKTKELSASMEQATKLSDRINSQIQELDVARVSSLVVDY
jgi:hypothetical protein